MDAFVELMSVSAFDASSNSSSASNQLSVCSDSMRGAVDAVETVSRFSAIYVTPVVSVIGLLSNALLCAVILQPWTEIGRKGKVMYCAIAVADSLQILVNSVGRVFVGYGLKPTFLTVNIELCKTHAFLSAFTMGLSNSFAAVFAVERCLSVHQSTATCCSHIRLRFLLVAVTLLEVVVASPLFWITELADTTVKPSRRSCEVIPTESAFTDVVFTFKMLCNAYLPCLLLFCSDVALLVFLVGRRRQNPHSHSHQRPQEDRCVESKGRMKAIISNTKACVVISSLRCGLLLVCIGVVQAYYMVLKYDGGWHPDHCIADLLQALSVIFFCATVIVLSSNFYLLLWRLQPFYASFRKLCRRDSARINANPAQCDAITNSINLVA